MLMESLSAHYNHSDTPEPDSKRLKYTLEPTDGIMAGTMRGGLISPSGAANNNRGKTHYAPSHGPPPRHEHQSQGYNPSGGYHNQDDNQSGYRTHRPPNRPPAGTQYYGPEFEDHHHNRAQPNFQYSQCDGKKKALSIGINYFGQDGQLSGCINDSKNVTRFLCSQFGYQENDIVVLTDEATNPRQLPTRENMIRAMEWLVRDAQPNDSLFFHYSGHGGQTKDLDGDEEDGFDEVVYPVDYVENGHITDSDMHDIMVKPLPAGCRLTAIYDSCHSGTALDLPYVYSTEGKIKEPNLAAEIGQGLLGAVTSYARGDMSGVLQSAMGIFKSATSSTKAEKIAKATRTSPADVISWSGCKDDQTSADTQEAGEATGAMSFAFVSSLRQNPQQSYQQLLNSVR
ncbi:Ca(2+)-dependent cysteine protease [Pleurotus ostreatus]|uniref:Ca(2+)-dependent cysteine protease n=1 Tax=Pleurotus ostreatus TaxID=5322 RepID=A0A8H7DNT3_PLEOS|nr:Ca(2+)-dependent cysteine protease [Pleurotus ostreatus]KAF7422772.1 Ca(2+)-dependent cysteine protease [Pleurotus ostreatus]